MKLLTWNINGGKKPEIWRFIQENINPDVCFLQEYFESTDCKRPANTHIIHNSVQGNPHYWDAVIFTKTLELSEVDFKDFSGRITVAKIKDIKSRSICLINIHAQHIDGYYTKWMQKVLDFLEPIIITNKNNLVISGDLNTAIDFDEGGKTDNRDVLNRLSSYGLDRYPQTNEQKTYRHRRNIEDQYTDDYIFISKNFKVLNFKVLFDEEIGELSDHNPLVLEFV